MIRKWNKEPANVGLKITDAMRAELELPADALTIEVRLLHSGYNDPGRLAADPDDSVAPEEEIYIDEITEAAVTFAEKVDEPLSVEQIDTLMDGYNGPLIDAI